MNNKTGIKTLKTNLLDYFDSELKKSNKLEIISPFITEDVTQFILKYLTGNNVRLLTRYNLRDFYSGVSNLEALKLFYKKGTEIRGVYRLHSKLYIFDERTVIITSANFTKGGMLSNMEFGVMITNDKVVKECKIYFDEIWNKADNRLTLETIQRWERKIKSALKRKVKTENESELNDEGKNCFGDNTSKAKLITVRKFTGYKKSKSNGSNSKRYFIKYIGATDGREPLSEKISEEIKNSECDNRVFYSYHPHQVSDGDVVYFGRITEDPDDYAIIGRGIGVKHVSSRDVVTPAEIKIKKWKKKYKYFNQVHSCEFINGRLEDCTLLKRDIISKFQYRTLLTTQSRWNDGERDIEVSRSLMQKQFVEITPEVAIWLDKKLAKQFKIKGILTKDGINKSTEILSKRIWRHHLINRKSMGSFLIPRAIRSETKVSDGTKRLLFFEFDNGIRLRGTASITSGIEISIPKHLHHYFQEAKWFDCEIIDNNLYEKVNLDLLI